MEIEKKKKNNHTAPGLLYFPSNRIGQRCNEKRKALQSSKNQIIKRTLKNNISSLIL